MIEFEEKIKDEKMQLVTAEEFVKLHQESLTAIRNNDKLQEQLNTAKKVLTEIASPNVIGAARIPLYRKIASDALAALEGEEDDRK